jgi:clan AA aspartic protease (TIGR02281 family)
LDCDIFLVGEGNPELILAKVGGAKQRRNAAKRARRAIVAARGSMHNRAVLGCDRPAERRFGPFKREACTLKKLLLTAIASLMVLPAHAELDKRVPMHDKGAATFYVQSDIEGYGAVELMVDTGSGYMTINEHTLAVLEEQGRATFVKQLAGVMADGSRRVVPVYRLSSVNVGGCVVNDVEAAVFPGKTRHILGLNVLKQMAPFTFSVEPPMLMLSNCRASSTVAHTTAPLQQPPR